MTHADLHPSIEECSAFGLAPLPSAAVAILVAEGAPPRLVAHLSLVHDVALRLLRSFNKAWPKLAIDKELVAFGAATHDIGKARIRKELSEPGVEHEAVGEALLLEHGISAERARFARSHGADVRTLPLDDVMVVLADNTWKGKRRKELDDRVIALLTAAAAAPAWDAFLRLDGILSAVARDADKRLDWQGQHSC